MKTLTFVACAAAFILSASAAAVAQDKAPQDKGASGWSGGSRDPNDAAGKNKDLDKNSPEAGHLYATGLDLKGPPRAYPPDRPPE